MVKYMVKYVVNIYIYGLKKCFRKYGGTLVLVLNRMKHMKHERVQLIITLVWMEL